MSTDDPSTQPRQVKIRWWHIALIALVVVAFLGLAYWQWTRFQSGSGTFQNLGYALQWPLFALFVVVGYRATLKYENERLEAEHKSADSGEGPARYESGSEARIDDDFLPHRPTVDVDTFNEMNDPRERRRRR